MGLKIQFTGLLASPTSWARVARGMLSRLTAVDGIDLKIKPTRGKLWTKNFPLPAEIEKAIGEWRAPDFELMFAYPPLLKQYHDKKSRLWNFSVYEPSRLPEAWVDPLNEDCNRVLVPSRHNYNLYQNSGVCEEQLELIPYGYSVRHFQAPLPWPEKERLNILTVATPHYRKGLDLLLAVSDLLKQTRLRWRVQLPYVPKKEKSEFWEDTTIKKKLETVGFDVRVGRLSDAEITELYREANLLVQPSRSEGFGLAILEGMAAGRPVVTSNWGGQLDFAGPGMIRVKGQLRPARDCQYDEKHPDAEVFEPDKDDFRHQLIQLLDRPGELKELGLQARKSVRDFTWKNAARKLADLLKRSY